MIDSTHLVTILAIKWFLSLITVSILAWRVSITLKLVSLMNFKTLTLTRSTGHKSLVQDLDSSFMPNSTMIGYQETMLALITVRVSKI